MKILMKLLLLCTCSTAGFGQDTNRIPWMARENRIGLAIGIGSLTYVDKQVSPLTYQGKPKVVRLFYQLETNDWLMSFDIDIKVGSARSKLLANRMIYFQEEKIDGKQEDKKFPVGGSFMMGKISLGAFRKITSTEHSTFQVAVGGRITNEMFYPQGWTTAGIFNALSFSPEANVQHQINQSNTFNATLRVPVLTQLTRMPYHNTVSLPDKNLVGGFFRNKQWVSFGKYLAPVASVGYTYLINNNWGAGFNYELSGYQITIPKRMYAASHAFTPYAFHQF